MYYQIITILPKPIWLWNRYVTTNMHLAIESLVIQVHILVDVDIGSLPHNWEWHPAVVSRCLSRGSAKAESLCNLCHQLFSSISVETVDFFQFLCFLIILYLFQLSLLLIIILAVSSVDGILILPGRSATNPWFLSLFLWA